MAGSITTEFSPIAPKTQTHSGLPSKRASTMTATSPMPPPSPAWQPEPTPNPDNSNEPIAPTVPQGGKQLRREISSEPVAPKMREGGEHLGREVACTWELLEKGQPHFEATTVHIRPPRLGADPQHRAHNPSDPCRHILTSIDIASLAAGGLMTATILNFNQNVPGTCPSPSADPRWAASIPLLRHMPQALRCPDPSTYVLALSVYSAVGMLQVALEPRYWADCGLVAALATVGAGGVYGPRYMVDVLILGGFLSLVCSKVVAWYVDYCGRGERGVGRN
ncbi:hypothetical protein C8A05DRAFT_30592 [Staphylotrichum tortipilum]|uniref:Uncharacterized protein n=1 Tax=Staphylotrichum tortipilum TaxID=2831512 RepID=A0AAN6MRL1_9PEZI|nr:hypothetical protein C8A05DRAFT_30592 [Staphylotrichum longicolle]